MTGYETLDYAVRDRILTLTLDRPDQLNALTVTMADELVAAFDRAGADDDVAAVVVTGRGRAFCAGEIARCLADLVTLDAPTLTLLLGEGTGGGALALLPADRVIAAQHAWLSPLPPEGASAIVHRDLSHAADMARSQNVRSLDLREAGIVDRIVLEKPDAADEPEEFCARLGAVLRYELAELLHRDRSTLVTQRTARYQRIGAL